MRIIKLFMSLFQSFFVQLQQRRPRLEHHIAADEILKSWLKWTHWFVSAAAGWSRRRKEEDGRVFGELRERRSERGIFLMWKTLLIHQRKVWNIHPSLTTGPRRHPRSTLSSEKKNALGIAQSSSLSIRTGARRADCIRGSQMKRWGSLVLQSY